MDEEAGWDNDEEENALDVLAAWWDRRCESAGSRALTEDERDINCERFAITSAGTSGEVGGFQIPEEQRELQGPKLKSRGTEIVTSATIKIISTIRFIEQLAKDSIVVEHHALYHDAGWLCRTSHVYWVPMPSLALLARATYAERSRRLNAFRAQAQ